MFKLMYVGAPYGENELGEEISKHHTLEKAIETRNRLQSQAKYYGSNTLIRDKYDNKVAL